MRQSPICKQHQEAIIYFGFDKDSKKQVGACRECPAKLNGPFKILEDVEKTIDQHKKYLIECTNQIKFDNTNTLKKLIDCLNEYKFQQVKKIDGIIENILIVLPQLERSISNIQEQIINYETYDEDNLILFSEKIIQEDTLGINKNQISEQLRQLCTGDFPEEPFKILDQVLQKSILQHILKLLESSTTDEQQLIWREHHFYLAQRYVELQKFFDESMNTLRSQLFTRCKKLQEKFQKQLDMFDQIINKKRNFTISQVKQQINSSLNCLTSEDLKKTVQMKKKYYCSIQEYERKQLKDFLKTQINEFNKNHDLKLLFKKNHETINILKKQEIIKTKTLFEYELLKDSTIKQSEWCCAIAINHSSSILLAACNKRIKVFDFKGGEAVAKETLSDHKDYIYCLQFFKQQNNFVSASHDSTIKIWCQNDKCKYQSIQTLNAHTDQIWCIVIKSNLDEIISGSRDDTIRVWKIMNQVWFNDQIINGHKNSVYSLSLNETENKLISCGKDNQILVMENRQDKWEIQQKIKTDGGKRLCFITNDIFAFQPSASQQMLIYEFQINQNQFFKTQEVQMSYEDRSDEYLFPQQFIKSKQFLINKFENYINIIVRKENGQFKLKKFIRFTSNEIFGTMSEDGEFLVTWDNEKQEIQVRKFKEI